MPSINNKRNGTSHIIQYLAQVEDIIILKDIKVASLLFKVPSILLDGWILPFGGFSTGLIGDQQGYPFYFDKTGVNFDCILHKVPKFTDLLVAQ